MISLKLLRAFTRIAYIAVCLELKLCRMLFTLGKGLLDMKKCFGFALVLLLVFVSFAACNGKDKDKASDQSNKYKVYYVDNKTSKIVSEYYTAKGKSKEELVKELLAALRKDPQNIVNKKALPDSVFVKNFSFSKDGQLTINFDESYDELKGIPEVLCRATIVKTLSQIPGIEFIVFSVNGQQLRDTSGSVVGIMTADTFIDSTGAETDYKVPLYFASKDGKKLIESRTNIYFSGKVSIEELVLKQLINGPTEKGMYGTIPEGTTLLNVTTKEGICYVDFNEKFLDKIPDITDDVAIYSVVNTLVELPNINKVQLMINGSVEKIYRENTRLDTLFERNLSLIKDSK